MLVRIEPMVLHFSHRTLGCLLNQRATLFFIIVFFFMTVFQWATFREGLPA